MKALYRKYRPTTLATVVGQDHIIKPLQQALTSGKFSHAYLFTGPRGCGKTSVARIFAHEINHFPYELEDNYVDIVEIDAASNRGIDNIRELREKAAIAPTQGKYKIYIIDEVHMLTKEAFNALLKTLEEPPAHVIFIMATTDPDKVPVTITSRTQVFHFHLAPPEVMLTHLQKIATQENIPITEDALQIIIERGGGSFRDSLSLLDQISTLAGTSDNNDSSRTSPNSSSQSLNKSTSPNSPKSTKNPPNSAPSSQNPTKNPAPITAQTLITALRLPDPTLSTHLLATYQTGDLAAISTELHSLLATGTDPTTLATHLMQEIIAHPQPQLLPLLQHLTTVTPPFPEAKLLLALTTSVPVNSNPINSTPVTTNPPISTPVNQNPTPVTTATPSTPKTQNPTPVPEKSPHPPIIPQKPKKVNTNSSKPNPTPDNPQQTPPPTPEPPAPTPESTPESTAPFSWPAYLTAVKSSSAALHTRLQKTPHYFDPTTSTLHLYPAKSIDKSIFVSPNNRPILLQHLAGATLTIHDLTDPLPPQLDPLASLAATTPPQESTPENPTANQQPPNPQNSSKNPSTFSQLSAIMGRGIQEVNNDGEIPF